MSKLTTSTAIATAFGALVLAAPAAWARHEAGWEYAKVVRVEPIYREIRVREPREICHEEPVTERIVYRGHSDPGAVLVGAVIGGVIGHQFGSGRGNDLATAAGAVIGAQHGAANSYRHGRVVERTVYETSCRTVREARTVREIDGYDVTYRYHGRLYRTRTDYDPGRRIKVRMDVAPGYDD